MNPVTTTATTPTFLSLTHLSNDWNFTGLSTAQMGILCTHQLPIRTPFAKLVLTLQEHPKMNEWIQQQPYLQQLTDTHKIDLLLTAINTYGHNRSSIHLEDADFWKAIVDVFLALDSSLPPPDTTTTSSSSIPSNDSFEHNVLRKVNKTMRQSHHSSQAPKYLQKEMKKKSLKQKTYWI